MVSNFSKRRNAFFHLPLEVHSYFDNLTIRRCLNRIVVRRALARQGQADSCETIIEGSVLNQENYGSALFRRS